MDAPKPALSTGGVIPSERQLVHDIEKVRGELGELLMELDRRRQEVVELGVRLRPYLLPALLLGGGIVTAITALAASARRRRETAFSRLLGALRPRSVQVSPQPSIFRTAAVRILTSAGSAVLGLYLNRWAERMAEREEGTVTYYDRRRSPRGPDVREMH
ncbi:MAG: hypothetical protein AB2A00_00590 [Myxococcota bacterium]